MNYYNEHDPKAAAWLRELIAAKLIPVGDVDERDIRDVAPSDLHSYAQCHFFAGIGGWAYALELAGWPVDRPIWTGSCPCQPFSVAGKRKGTSDDRHLWPAFLRLITECRPPIVAGEQVASKDGRKWLAGVRTDLEAVGYRVGAADLCAASVGSPHIRQRLYWAADASYTDRRSGKCEEETGTRKRGERRWGSSGSRIAGRLVNPFQSRLEGHAGNGDDWNESGRFGTNPFRPAAQASGAGRVDDAASPRSQSAGFRPEGEAWDEARMCGSEQGRCDGGVADTERDGRGTDEPGRRQEGRDLDGRADPWSQSRTILCCDGKLRRVPLEPALFPLAHGVSGRVGLLRGAGNAIVSQVAAEFIQSYLDIQDQAREAIRGNTTGLQGARTSPPEPGTGIPT